MTNVRIFHHAKERKFSSFSGNWKAREELIEQWWSGCQPQFKSPTPILKNRTYIEQVQGES